MSRRAQVLSSDEESAATTGRAGRSRAQLGAALGLLAVLVLASAGAFDARGTEPFGTTPTSVRARVTTSAARAAIPRVVPVARTGVRFEHLRVRTPKPPTTTTTTSSTTTTTTSTVPVTAPPTTAYPTSSALCMQAVADVSWPPGWAVSCEGSRPGLLGATSRQGTQLFMRSGLSESFYLIVAGHEAGHAWDFARLSSSDIAMWCAARGCDAAHFFDGPGGPGWSEPGGAEDWAEAWRICHGGIDMRNYIGLGPPSAELCALQLRLVAN